MLALIHSAHISSVATGRGGGGVGEYMYLVSRSHTLTLAWKGSDLMREREGVAMRD